MISDWVFCRVFDRIVFGHLLDSLSELVVDPPLRVHGIEGLRVADVFAMTSIVTTNTHATCRDGQVGSKFNF